MTIIKLLEFEEGIRARPYLCPNGYPTVGIGKKLGDKCSEQELKERYSFYLPEPVARQWLLRDVQDLTDRLSNHPEIGIAFNSQNNARKAILLSMGYQMGVSGLAKFKNFLSSMRARDYDGAVVHMLDSKWARSDSTERAKRHASQILGGEWLEVYRG